MFWLANKEVLTGLIQRLVNAALSLKTLLVWDALELRSV